LSAGCMRTPEPRFYVLELPAAPRPHAAPAAAPRAALRIGIRDVRVAAYLDRPHIVTRAGVRQVRRAEFERWAAPLKKSVADVLAESLRFHLPDANVFVFPWPAGAGVNREVAIDLQRFDGRSGGTAALIAVWTVRVPGGSDGRTLSGRVEYSQPVTEPGYSGLVAGLSRLLDRFGGDLAKALQSDAARAGGTTAD